MKFFLFFFSSLEEATSSGSLKRTKSEVNDDCDLCGDNVGIYELKDFFGVSQKGKLSKRVDKIAKLKHNQKKHYAIMEQVQSERVTDKGLKTSTVTEYFVMGQNITKMSATEGADALLFRDAEKFANLPNVEDDQVGPLIVPGTYFPSTPVVSPEEMDFILENNKVGGTGEIGGGACLPRL